MKIDMNLNVKWKCWETDQDVLTFRLGDQEEGSGVGPVPIWERLPEGPLDGPEERVHGAPQEGPGGGIHQAWGSLWESAQARKDLKDVWYQP